MTAARRASLGWSFSELSPSSLDHISLRKNLGECSSVSAEEKKKPEAFNPLQPVFKN